MSNKRYLQISHSKVLIYQKLLKQIMNCLKYIRKNVFFDKSKISQT